MSPGLYRFIFLFQAIIILQCLCSSRAREISGRHKHHDMQEDTKDNKYSDHQMALHGNHNDHIGSSSYRMDLAVHVFFHSQDLEFGNKIPVYFSIKDPSKRPPLLSKQEADSIPFSSSKLPYLLQLFSLSQDSSQAKAMESTLTHCEFEPLKSENKFCSTSLESMLDSARDLFGSGTPFEVLTTNHPTNQTASVLQNYTITEEPIVIRAPKMLACHTLPYPYAVYYCHTQKSDNNLYKLMLAGENGEPVDAVAICHMDSSEWDPNHIAFRVLKTVPGESPICHFFPSDNLVWVASISASV